ncbi:MAG: hypothetical protein P4L81_08560, partial [Candidatus Pacebacteria bacterium]|nr:hypothetical protein [Candidatus Paceibacterota bacterium]
ALNVAAALCVLVVAPKARPVARREFHDTPAGIGAVRAPVGSSRSGARADPRTAVIAMATEKCIFCGAQPTTKEHVFSRWTHKYMAPRQPGKARLSIEDQFVDKSETRLVKMSGQLRDWQVKCVCGGTARTCNNGWMKSIEDRTKPIMADLIQGSERRITPSEQSIIATWAILKTMVSEYAGTYKGHIHYKQREYMKRHALAPTRGWAVWIGYYDRSNWVVEFVSRPMLLVPKSVAERSNDYISGYFNSNVTTQIIGKLFIHVIHFPMPSFIKWWRFRFPHRGAIFRIWPPAQVSIKWPSSALDDQAAERISDAVFAHIVTAQKRLVANAPSDVRERFLRVSADWARRLKR